MSLPIYHNFPRNVEIRRWAVNTEQNSQPVSVNRRCSHGAPSFVMLIHSEKKKEEVFSNIFRVGAKHQIGATESLKKLLKIALQLGNLYPVRSISLKGIKNSCREMDLATSGNNATS